MNKITCNLDTVTHVIINGKEFERAKLTDNDPSGKAVLLAIPCQKQSTTSKKNGKSFTFWAKIGNQYSGQQVGQNALRVDYYPTAGRQEAISNQFAG